MQNDDEVMDRLLRDAMRAERPPQLSPDFDARVLQRARPRRLSPLGRLVFALYVMAAAVTMAWLMRDLPLMMIGAAVVIGVLVAAGASAYGRRVTLGH